MSRKRNFFLILALASAAVLGACAGSAERPAAAIEAESKEAAAAGTAVAETAAAETTATETTAMETAAAEPIAAEADTTAETTSMAEVSGDTAPADKETKESAFADGASEGAASADGASEESASADGASEGATFTDGASEGAASADGASEGAVSADGASEESASADGASEGATFADGAFEGSASADGASEESASADGASEESASANGASEGAASADGASEESASADGASEEATSAGEVSGESVSANGAGEELPLDQWIEKDKERAYYDVLEGKTMNLLGDSYFSGHDIGSSKAWPKLLAIKYGMSCVNQGISGSTISNYVTTKHPMVNRYDILPDNDPDIVLVDGGRNDFLLDVPIGEDGSTDTATMKGALRTILEGLRQKYPAAKIICVTVWEVGGSKTNQLGLVCSDYGRAMLEVCEDMGIACINAMDTEDIGVDMTDIEFRNKYCEDSQDVSHLNLEGMKLVLPRFEERIAEICSEE